MKRSTAAPSAYTSPLPGGGRVPLLPPEEIHDLHRLFIELDVDLDLVRHALTPEIAAQLMYTGRPSDDLMVALNTLARMGRTLDGRIPLTDALEHVALTRSGRVETKRILEIRQGVGLRLVGQDPTLADSVAPTVRSIPPRADGTPPLDAAPDPSGWAVGGAGAAGGICCAVSIHAALSDRVDRPPELGASLHDMFAVGIPAGSVGLVLLWRSALIRKKMRRTARLFLYAMVILTAALVLVLAHLLCTKDIHAQRDPIWLVSLALFGGLGAFVSARSAGFTAFSAQSIVVPPLAAALFGGGAFVVTPIVAHFAGAGHWEVLERLPITMYAGMVYLVSCHLALLGRVWLARVSQHRRRAVRGRATWAALAVIALLLLLPLVRRSVKIGSAGREVEPGYLCPARADAEGARPVDEPAEEPVLVNPPR